ncbi:MAG: NrdJb [Xanthomonadales bacterium]|nr:NrdJb [Xanthomonadales bacterium]
MAIRINKKITGYSVARDDAPAADNTPAPRADAAHQDSASDDDGGAEIIHMHERVERPDRLEGHTYKIKSPLFEHALYVTINDIVLNQDTEHELRRPYEIFVNSKNMEHFQWMVALTRIMSAVFRKGGDVTFLVEELKAVFDPRGGYFKAGGVYMPSIVAELGVVIEDHLKKIGLMVSDEMTPEQKQLLAEKRAAARVRAKKKPELTGDRPAAAGADAGNEAIADRADSDASADRADSDASAGALANASLCPKCNAMALVLMDGCATCLSCGHSKCG